HWRSGGGEASPRQSPAAHHPPPPAHRPAPRPSRVAPCMILGVGISFNPMDPEFVADPYPTYHRLRREEPVHHSPLGFWVLTRYEDVVAALRDPRLAKEAIAAFVAARLGTTPSAGTTMSMLDRYSPDHTRLRGLVSKASTPRV